MLTAQLVILLYSRLIYELVTQKSNPYYRIRVEYEPKIAGASPGC
jgi:hypothetical protein